MSPLTLLDIARAHSPGSQPRLFHPRPGIHWIQSLLCGIQSLLCGNEKDHLSYASSLTSQGSYLYTVVADAAVGTARRTVEAAGGAPLHAHLDALDLHGFVKGGSEVVFLIFILLGCTEETSIKQLSRTCSALGKQGYLRSGLCLRGIQTDGGERPGTGNSNTETSSLYTTMAAPVRKQFILHWEMRFTRTHLRGGSATGTLIFLLYIL